MEKKLARQILKFGVVGGTAFLIDYIVMICLTEVLDLNYLISCAISFCLALIYNYILSIVWVFDVDRGKKPAQIFVVFIALSLIGLGINQFLMWLLVDVTGWGVSFDKFYMIAKLFVTGVVMVYNFVTRKIFLENDGKGN